MVVKRNLLVNARARRRAHDRRLRWIYGLNAVIRRLEVRPSSVREVRVVRRVDVRRGQVCRLAGAVGVPVSETTPRVLRELTGSSKHQGIAALAEPIEYQDLAVVTTGGPILVLDHIQDPYNFGALVRTAAAVAMEAVVIPCDRSAPVSSVTEKVAAGAANDVPICAVTNLRRCLLDLRALGYWSIALDVESEDSLFDIDVPMRVVLVLGGESGLRPLVARMCDRVVSIPMSTEVQSLNASVAGAIAMYELARRLGKFGPSSAGAKRAVTRGHQLQPHLRPP